MRSQALGLAEAVGLPVIEKRVALRQPWPLLPGGLLPMPLSALAPSGDRLAPPWPRLVVACGRRAIGAALAVKRRSRGRTLAAFVQNPEFGRARFDLVAAMAHDGVRGANVVTLQTALNRVTPERLATARETWRGRLSPAGGAPLLGVLVGGDNSSYRLTRAVADELIRVIEAAHRERGFNVALTPSRRTSEATKAILGEAMRNMPFGTLWDESGDNPYFGILALADRLIVTADSISMISEALATGRPVHVLKLEGGGRRHTAFLTRFIEDGLISPITGGALDLGFAGHAPINSTAEAAARLKTLLGLE